MGIIYKNRKKYSGDRKVDNGLVLKSASTGSTVLSSLTWGASGSGMYYTSVLNVGKPVVSVTLTAWAGLRTTDNIVPYIRGDGGTEISLMSNTNSFASSGSNVNIRYLYIDE